MTGGAVVLLLVAMAVFAPVLSPYDPVAQDAERVLHPPGALHWLGADNLGRDIWSRIAFGARVSLSVGILSVVLGSAAGALAGVVGGYYGRLADAVLQQAADALLAFPTLVLALGIMAVLGTSTANVILAIALVQAPRAARVVRSQALAVSSAEFVAAARIVGAGSPRVVLRHVLPHCVAPFLVISTSALGAAVVLEASLSFPGARRSGARSIVGRHARRPRPRLLQRSPMDGPLAGPRHLPRRLRLQPARRRPPRHPRPAPAPRLAD